jgi:Zn-dependent M28 family amino/carboxypeptidase
MRYLKILPVVLFCISCGQKPTTLEEVTTAISVDETRTILYTLASDQMKGRDSEHGGYELATNYVIDYLEKSQIKPFYPAFKDSLQTNGQWSYNLVGSIGAFHPEKPTILIGAHLDHIGIKQNDNLDSIFNGANDNATGSTAVLQIARFLATKQWEQNIIVALFADEEKGLQGAKHLSERMRKESVNLSYMINFEMLGATLTSGENQVYMTGYHLSNMPEVINKYTPDFVQFLPEAKQYNLFKRSDNYSFYQAFNVPAQTLSTFDFKNYEYYHKAGDEADQLDIENMNSVIRTSAFAISKMLEDNSSINILEGTQE